MSCSPPVATHSGILPWRIPWTEEPGGSTVHGVAQLDMTEWLSTHSANTMITKGLTVEINWNQMCGGYPTTLRNEPRKSLFSLRILQPSSVASKPPLGVWVQWDVKACVLYKEKKVVWKKPRLRNQSLEKRQLCHSDKTLVGHTDEPQEERVSRSVAQSCPTLCDPVDHSTPGLPVHHQLLKFTQTQVHGVGDGQGGLECCSPWGCKELDRTELLNWTDSPWDCKKLDVTEWLTFLLLASTHKGSEKYLFFILIFIWSSIISSFIIKISGVLYFQVVG